MKEPLRIFIGLDQRQFLAWHVLNHSIIASASEIVSVTPLSYFAVPLVRKGLTEFTYSRFLVPYLAGHKGWALFLDADMLVRSDIAELFSLADDRYSVMVVKNAQRFEWPSLMLFNCEKLKQVTPEFVEKNEHIMGLRWIPEEEIGDLPAEWNHCVGYNEPNPNAKLVHFTMGIPAFPETENSEHAENWKQAAQDMVSTVPWATLMGGSVHASRVMQAKFGSNQEGANG